VQHSRPWAAPSTRARPTQRQAPRGAVSSPSPPRVAKLRLSHSKGHASTGAGRHVRPAAHAPGQGCSAPLLLSFCRWRRGRRAAAPDTTKGARTLTLLAARHGGRECGLESARCSAPRACGAAHAHAHSRARARARAGGARPLAPPAPARARARARARSPSADASSSAAWQPKGAAAAAAPSPSANTPALGGRAAGAPAAPRMRMRIRARARSLAQRGRLTERGVATQGCGGGCGTLAQREHACSGGPRSRRACGAAHVHAHSRARARSLAQRGRLTERGVATQGCGGGCGTLAQREHACSGGRSRRANTRPRSRKRPGAKHMRGTTGNRTRDLSHPKRESYH
jgi:hypothetical protein